MSAANTDEIMSEEDPFEETEDEEHLDSMSLLERVQYLETLLEHEMEERQYTERRLRVLECQMAALMKNCNYDEEFEEDSETDVAEYEDSHASNVQLGSGELEGTTLLHKGWLEKRAMFNQFKKHWFLLYDKGILIYTDDKMTTDAKGVIYLQNAKLIEHAEINGIADADCFIIRSTNKDFLLKAPSSLCKQQWCLAIRKLLPSLVAPVRTIYKSGSFKISMEDRKEKYSTLTRIQQLESPETDHSEEDSSDKFLSAADRSSSVSSSEPLISRPHYKLELKSMRKFIEVPM